MEIREFIGGETERLVALFGAVLPDSPTAQAHDLKGPEEFLRDPRTFVLGAYLDDVPIGLAWGLQMRSPSGRLTTYVHELDVHETWRRRGVGSALSWLLAHMIDETARQLGHIDLIRDALGRPPCSLKPAGHPAP